MLFPVALRLRVSNRWTIATNHAEFVADCYAATMSRNPPFLPWRPRALQFTFVVDCWMVFIDGVSTIPSLWL